MYTAWIASLLPNAKLICLTIQFTVSVSDSRTVSSTSTLDEMLEFEAYAQTLAFGSGENEEGARAFREKRAPRFKGPS